MAGPIGDEEMAAWRPFVITATSVVSALDAEMRAAFDISHLDHGMLAVLEVQPGRQARMTDLARTFCVDPSNITYRVRRLEKRGLVERAGCPTDRRVVYARLTDRGAQLMRDAWPMHAAGIRRHFLDHVTPDQLPVIAEVFIRIVEAQHRDGQVSLVRPF